VLPVHLHPVLLLALYGAVADELALAGIRELFPIIVVTVSTKFIPRARGFGHDGYWLGKLALVNYLLRNLKNPCK
jgi:hypothetical protein